VPLLTVAGWIGLGPRGLVGPRIIGWSLVFPLAWLVATFVRGPIVGWYPYPFLDVLEIGYARALLNVAGIAAGYLAIAAGVWRLDGWLSRRNISRSPAPR